MDTPRAKLTLSVRPDVVRQAKHFALDRGISVSDMVESALQRVVEDSLRNLAGLTFRAWHDFPEGTAFVPAALLALYDRGFEVRPQKSGFEVARNGRRYIVQHRSEHGQQVLRVHPYGRPHEEVARLDVSELATMVRRARQHDYSAPLAAVWRAAEKVREHAEAR